MKVAESITQFSVNRPRLVTGIMVLVTGILALVAVLPSIWPETFSMLYPVKVDTDPENMLSANEPVRIYHHDMKEELSLHDMVVVGIVNESHPDGVFNPESLRKIYELTEYARTLQWDEGGVVEVDIIAPSTVDNMEQGGPGTVRFEWLMPSPPATREEALAVRTKAQRIPFLQGTVLSENGKALCLYLPLTSKDLSYRIYSKLQEKIATLSGQEQYFVTGLPVAEDTFGVEMFKQLATTAPVAMVVIFLLMLVFFRKFILVVSPMIVAMVSVFCTTTGRMSGRARRASGGHRDMTRAERDRRAGAMLKARAAMLRELAREAKRLGRPNAKASTREARPARPRTWRG